MENIGDYIYLIVIAIAAIASVIKPKKKVNTPAAPSKRVDREVQPRPATPYNTGKASPPPPPQAKPKTWQELLESLTEKHQPKQQPAKATQKRETRFIDSHLSAENRLGKKAPVTSSITERIRKFSDHDQMLGETEGSIDIDFSDINEIKKGIIYAEIFNRRY